MKRSYQIILLILMMQTSVQKAPVAAEEPDPFAHVKPIMAPEAKDPAKTTKEKTFAEQQQQKAIKKRSFIAQTAADLKTHVQLAMHRADEAFQNFGFTSKKRRAALAGASDHIDDAIQAEDSVQLSPDDSVTAQLQAEPGTKESKNWLLRKYRLRKDKQRHKKAFQTDFFKSQQALTQSYNEQKQRLIRIYQSEEHANQEVAIATLAHHLKILKEQYKTAQEQLKLTMRQHLQEGKAKADQLYKKYLAHLQFIDQTTTSKKDETRATSSDMLLAHEEAENQEYNDFIAQQQQELQDILDHAFNPKQAQETTSSTATAESPTDDREEEEEEDSLPVTSTATPSAEMWQHINNIQHRIELPVQLPAA